ncbi:MAG: adenosylcobinamide-GDP ribazoletransferase [Dehalococcoidia bacterium]
MVRRWLSAPLLAFGFLTVIPVRGVSFDEAGTVGRSLRWFPFVGLLVGGVLAAVDRLAMTAFSPEIAVALVLVASAALTGALHLDGLGDTADGVFGGRTPERRLEIMRDSRIGSYGVVAVVLVLLTMYAALVSTVEHDRWRALVIVPTLSRAGMVYAIASFAYARPTGLGRTFKDHVSRSDVVFAGIAGLVVAVAVLRTEGAILWSVGVVAALAIGWYCTRRLGGLTGDTFGAIAAVTEALLFCLVAAEWW